jgi:DNA primase
MSDAVQQIKERLSILDVVSPYVELHKAGKNFKGKSPFTAEKTPSFYVSPDRGMYYCFSTSQGGDMFNFVQSMEGVDFKEALKILAQKAGVELVPEDPKKRSERERLYAALETATTFYEEKLPKESEAAAYLEKRGVKKETITKWRIGFAPGPPKAGWRETKEALEAKGYTRDELLKAGLIKSAEGGKEPFDVFRDRIMFPMAEPSGKVVAFSGRILHPDDKAPKYVNSPETLLYKKSELLFGYDKAKHGIRHLNFSLIVEGQFDVVMCHQAGYQNAVAVSGTALTLHHVQLLERLSDKVVLALDADRAGIAAMQKAAGVMLQRGLDVKVAELPIGKDPADVIAEDQNEFKKIIGKAVPVIEFMLHVLRRETTDDRSFKLKTQQEVYPFVLLLPSRVDQYAFAEIVAKVTGVPVDVVWYEIERLRDKATDTRFSNVVRETVNTSSSMSDDKSVSSTAERTYYFLLAATQVIDGALATRVEQELKKIQTIGTIAEPEAADLAGLIFSLEQQFAELPPLAVTEEVVAKLNQLKLGLIRHRLAEYREQLAEVESQSNNERFSEVLQAIKEFETKLREPAYKVETFLATDP